jgi:hypothetical protein
MTVSDQDAVPLLPAPTRRSRRNRWLWRGLYILFVIAIGLRLYNLTSGFWAYYEHDMESHVENVKYVATHHWPAPMTEDWNEYDQPVLYYIIAATFYNTKENIEPQNEANLAPLGLCISIATLFVVLLSLRYISSWIHRYTLFIFMAVMPSFVLSSSCVGNDGLVGLFGALSLLFILKLNRNPGSNSDFGLSIGSFWGAIFTKANGVALLMATPWILWRKAVYDSSWKQSAKRMAWVGLIMAVLTAIMFYRQWCPESHRFIFAHPVPGPGSRVIWEYMEIKEDLRIYAVRFDLPALIAAGMTTTTDSTPDMVRYSFPSWEYGNMLLGEWEYAPNPVLLVGSRLVIISGTVLLLGLVLFFFMTLFSSPVWPWQKVFTLNRLALLLIGTSTILILKLIWLNPDACGADYRYQAPTFSWMGYSIGRGLCAFPRSIVWKVFVSLLLTFFVGSCFYLLFVVYDRPL